MEDSKLSDAELEAILKETFKKITEETNSKDINFIPVVVENNQFDGGLGPSRFHLIEECGLSKDKLLGKENVTEEEFVTFWSNVANKVPRLKYGKTRIQSVMKNVLEAYKNYDDYVARVNALVKFFEKADKDKQGTLDKSEVAEFCKKMEELKIEHPSDEESQETKKIFKWVDRNEDGTISIFELISAAMSKTFLAKKKEEWYSYLKSIGIDLQA